MGMNLRSLRLLLAGTLVWAGMHVCLMPQAQCESVTESPCCRCHHGNLPKCCHGVHLVEAGVPSGVAVATVVQPSHPFALPVATAGLTQSPSRPGNILTVAEPTPRHPPPRETSGRSPPLP
jgi:hypothetical protein